AAYAQRAFRHAGCLDPLLRAGPRVLQFAGPSRRHLRHSPGTRADAPRRSVGGARKIVIAGQGKSGTAALFHKIRAAVPDSTRLLFEPRAYEPEPDDGHVLAKVLIDPPGYVDFSTFEPFDKKILIVRDPRDNLISRLLY